MLEVKTMPNDELHHLLNRMHQPLRGKHDAMRTEEGYVWIDLQYNASDHQATMGAPQRRNDLNSLLQCIAMLCFIRVPVINHFRFIIRRVRFDVNPYDAVCAFWRVGELPNP